ncbi:MAG: ABC transporter ATP-binding protein [Thermotogae bacterium]|nr:ABC transporter ATP-binding protein [Thermotogota bacterium]
MLISDKTHSNNEPDELIKLVDVYKTYTMGDTIVKAVNGVSLRIKKGEFVVLMGPSGSGKSTLMHLIGCLDSPDDGKFFLKGRDISKADDYTLSAIRKNMIGFVFQQFNLIPRFTALENVELPMIYNRIPKHLRISRAKELLEMVGLSNRIYHRPSQMSGGQMQRVAIARALANNPEILLADEPTGNLDSVSSKEIMELFKKLHDKGLTIVLVTHEPDIAKYGKRIIRLKDGKIISDEEVK